LVISWLGEPLGDLFNGISLLIAQPFKKGDWINVNGEIGKITEFNWRSVKIINRDNELIIIPNNILGKEKIKNLSRPNPFHTEMVSIGFSYDDHPEKVKKYCCKY
jgi:small-conductance mechanosensitive channel